MSHCAAHYHNMEVLFKIELHSVCMTIFIYLFCPIKFCFPHQGYFNWLCIEIACPVVCVVLVTAVFLLPKRKGVFSFLHPNGSFKDFLHGMKLPLSPNRGRGHLSEPVWTLWRWWTPQSNKVIHNTGQKVVLLWCKDQGLALKSLVQVCFAKIMCVHLYSQRYSMIEMIGWYASCHFHRMEQRWVFVGFKVTETKVTKSGRLTAMQTGSWLTCYGACSLLRCISWLSHGFILWVNMNRCCWCHHRSICRITTAWHLIKVEVPFIKIQKTFRSHTPSLCSSPRDATKGL